MFDFSTFPVLHTPRLLLRELTPNDEQSVYAFRSDYEVTRLNIGAAYTSPLQAQLLIEGIRQEFEQQVAIRWGITRHDSAEVIGMCGFNYWNRTDRRASIGYDLARPAWGQGYMPEALKAMIAFGFEQMQLNRIEADCSAENVASQRVLEKLGFFKEGCSREQYFEHGRFHDLFLYSFLRREWQGKPHETP